MMMRLIDADTLQFVPKETKHVVGVRGNGKIILTMLEAIQEVIDKTPTIDAVPVVRCKDCKYRGNSFACPMCHDESIYDDDDGYDDYTYDRTDDDGFCNNGERWDEDAVD